MARNSQQWRTFALLITATLAPLHVSSARTSPEAQTLKGEVLDDQNRPIAEAACTLNGRMLPSEGISVSTGPKGQYQFVGLAPGAYTVTCAAFGHQPLQKKVEITDAAPPFIQMVLPPVIVVHESVEVREKASTVSRSDTAPPSSLHSPQLIELPLVERKFKAALPLTPGVVRTPDGRINIKGVPESQGLLLVDSAQTVDPVTGSFSIEIPLQAIESLQVYKNIYRASDGGFTGGLTTIQTKAPSDKWQLEVQNITPNPRIKSGHLVGIADYNPSAYLTGPILKNRLNFSETFEYDMDKQPVRGLAWPNNEIKTNQVTSFTSFQYTFSPTHLLTVNANVFPLRRQFANINSLVPKSASSDYGQKGFSFEATDRYLFKSGAVLTTLAQGTKFDSYAHGQGPQDMLVTPNGWSGNFFNAYSRASDQEEILETFRFPQKDWHGKHEITLGGGIFHRSFDGESRSHPVLLLRPEGTVAERVDFQGPGQLAAQDTESNLFAQDHWTIGEQLALDAGLRFSSQTLGSAANFAPRIGLVYSPGTAGKTILRGGFGLFFDHVPLLGGAFTDNPTRVVSLYDTNGLPFGAPLRFRNIYQRVEDGIGASGSSKDLNSVPFNLSWSVEVDRELRPHLVAKLSYLSSRTYNQFFVNPVVSPGTEPALVLSNNAGSRYQELESTLRVRLAGESEWNISYIFSRARGDLNTLGQVYIPFEQPVIRPNFYAALPSDVPHRVIAWGRAKTHLWGITASPVVDLHSGFPYSDVDSVQNYVGAPNSHRFPRFFSVDLKLSKEFHLPFPLIKKYLMRGALTIFNLTNNSNPRDVFNNIASPYFGHYVGFQHLFFDTQLDILY
ncbi:MAG TPA: TonB-dependent receptor [Terriglobia bacterium]|nr:TonB-dependent receptor [Terriglobia bacterium]